MFNTVTKVKRKYIEKLLSHWYPGQSIFSSDEHYRKKNKKTKSFTDDFAIAVSSLIWFFTKPLLVFLTLLNYVLIFLKKKDNVSAITTRRIQKPFPKIVAIGNLTLGGSGKTPTTICLIRKLLVQGIRPAVISRGYKGRIDRHNKKSQFVHRI